MKLNLTEKQVENIRTSPEGFGTFTVHALAEDCQALRAEIKNMAEEYRDLYKRYADKSDEVTLMTMALREAVDEFNKEVLARCDKADSFGTLAAMQMFNILVRHFPDILKERK